MQSPTGRRLSLVLITAGSALAAIGIVAPSAQADTGPTAYNGNPKCAEVDASLVQFKIDIGDFEDGTYTRITNGVEVLPEDAELPSGFHVVITSADHSGGPATFDWAAFVADGDDAGTDPDAFPIDLVQVKAGPGGHRYAYDAPGATSDTGMLSPKDSISHADFCFGAPVANSSDGAVTTDETDGTDGTDDPGTGGTDDLTTDATDDPGTDGTDASTTDGTDDPSTDGTDDLGTDGTDDLGTDGSDGTDDLTTDGTDDLTTDGTDDPTTDGPEAATDGTDTANTPASDGPTTESGGDGSSSSSGDPAPQLSATNDDRVPTQVEGVVIPQPLPRTGAEDRSLALVGGGFVLFGLAAMAMRRIAIARS